MIEINDSGEDPEESEVVKKRKTGQNVLCITSAGDGIPRRHQ